MQENISAEAQLDPVVNTDTLVPAENAPASEVSGNAAQENPSQVATDSAAVQPTQTDAERAALAQRREEGKLRQVQQQLEEERKKSQAYAEWIAAKPERLSDALIEQGYTPEQATAKVNELRSKGYWNTPVQQPTYQQPVYQQPPVDPYTAVREVMLMDKFLAEAPDLDFRGKSREDAEIARNEYMNVAKVAESLLSANAPGVVDELSALRKAYSIVTGNQTLPNRQAAENARVEALATSVANQSGTMPPPSSGAAPKRSVNLTPEQQAAARANGMTDEDYAKYI